MSGRPTLNNESLWHLHASTVGEIARIIQQMIPLSDLDISGLGSRGATGFTYNGSNQLTGFTSLEGVVYTITYPDASHIRIFRNSEGREITLNGLALTTSVLPI